MFHKKDSLNHQSASVFEPESYNQHTPKSRSSSHGRVKQNVRRRRIENIHGPGSSIFQSPKWCDLCFSIQCIKESLRDRDSAVTDASNRQTTFPDDLALNSCGWNHGNSASAVDLGHLQLVQSLAPCIVSFVDYDRPFVLDLLLLLVKYAAAKPSSSASQYNKIIALLGAQHLLTHEVIWSNIGNTKEHIGYCNFHEGHENNKHVDLTFAFLLQQMIFSCFVNDALKHEAINCLSILLSVLSDGPLNAAHVDGIKNANNYDDCARVAAILFNTKGGPLMITAAFMQQLIMLVKLWSSSASAAICQSYRLPALSLLTDLLWIPQKQILHRNLHAFSLISLDSLIGLIETVLSSFNHLDGPCVVHICKLVNDVLSKMACMDARHCKSSKRSSDTRGNTKQMSGSINDHQNNIGIPDCEVVYDYHTQSLSRISGLLLAQFVTIIKLANAKSQIQQKFNTCGRMSIVNGVTHSENYHAATVTQPISNSNSPPITGSGDIINCEDVLEGWIDAFIHCCGTLQTLLLVGKIQKLPERAIEDLRMAISVAMGHHRAQVRFQRFIRTFQILWVNYTSESECGFV